MPSINPYARDILKKNIFKNINSFYELENRIANSGDIGGRGIETTKGDIFEIFVEALLNVNKKYKKNKVYPSFATPSKLKNKLSLSLSKTEMGFDGVYEENNLTSIYQVKYRNIKNGSLTWRELSTFIGVSEKAHIRHLFTNIDNISNEFLKKERIIITSRKDFIKLKKIEFTEIENWLFEKKKKISRHKPEYYQIEALNKISDELKINDRTTAVLACGTGKTNIALWTFENLKPKNTIVFVPSISLIKQIRADWLEQTKLKKIKSIQICSFKETSQREDELKLSNIDVDFETTTNIDVIRNFLKTKSLVPKIIFCTYQSSKVLSKASKNIYFDFAIFDEAHRTARISSRKKNEITGFNLPLYDEHIKIKKRLFLTATRRISNNKKIYNAGDPEITLSMENETLYGKICHSLSFKEAAKLGCIAKFKIILSYVTSNEVNKELRVKSTTIVDGNEIKTEQVAKQIALKKALEKYRIKKVFTFHNTVPAAKSFCANTNEGISNHLHDFYTNSIDGKMKLAKREFIMESFKNSEKAILSNARCLIEGVDVPSVEMVAFMDNKNSEIDIVQAAGRALRNRNLNKKFGYILIPVFVEQKKNEKISEALERTNFENIAQILKAMKEHDSEIAQIINEYVFNKKKSKGFGGRSRKKIDEIIEGNSSIISKDKLFETILNKSFASLTTKWDEMIFELEKFKKTKGHLNVTSQENYILFKWITEVRRRISKNQLFQHQLKELEKLGFSFIDPRVTINNTDNLVSKKYLSKKLKVSEAFISTLEKMKIIKEIGKGKHNKTGTVTSLFKDISIQDLKKITGLDFIHESNVYTISALSQNNGFDRNIIKQYISAKKIKPLGKKLSSGPSGVSKKDLGSPVFRYITTKEISKHFGILEKLPQKYFTLRSMSHYVEKKLNCSASVNLLKQMKSKGKIKPIGKYFLNGGIRDIYPKYDIRYLTKAALPLSFLTNDMVTLKALSKKLEIDKGTLENYIIKTGIILPVAKGLNHVSGSISNYYSSKINKTELEKKVGFKFLVPKGCLTISPLSKKIGVKEKVLRNIFIKLKIKSLGKALTNSGISDYYKILSKEQIKKKLDCDYLSTPKSKNITTINGITKLFKEKYKKGIGGHTIIKIFDKNNIKPCGRGI